jgi:ADP-heptose:LPS heptosyltransferase
MRFDLAIDLRRQADTRVILQHSGARWLAGFDQDYGAKFLDIAVEFEGDVARNFKRSHVSDSLIQLVDTVAAACESNRQGVLSPMPAAAARARLSSLPGMEQMADALFARPVVAVHTGAGAVNKQWPAASFAGLIDLLVGHEEVNVAVIGGPDEAEFAADVLRQTRRSERVFSLVGKTSLKNLPIALLACDLYVGIARRADDRHSLRLGGRRGMGTDGQAYSHLAARHDLRSVLHRARRGLPKKPGLPARIERWGRLSRLPPPAGVAQDLKPRQAKEGLLF